MSDRYARFASSRVGHAVAGRLGLPRPPTLRRYRPGQEWTAGPVLIGGTGRLAEPATELVSRAGLSIAATAFTSDLGAVVYDATGIAAPEGLRGLFDFFHPLARSLHSSGRVIILGTPPEDCRRAGEAVAQHAIEGFVRSIGKEFGRGITAQLVYVRPGGEGSIESTLAFLLSARSAYISGQVIRIAAAAPDVEQLPRVALVTGAARGIGAAIVSALAREGATVLCVDVPAAGESLATVANEVGGAALQLDLTAPDADRRLADHIRARYGQVHTVVHNAGITRDRTIAKMSPETWDSVLRLNLTAVVRLSEYLLAADLVASPGRIVGVASIAGIAGNRGQTNYATSKAGVIGFVRAMAPALAKRAITVNAVAPGFIETDMTANMPVMIREAGRRMNSMLQGGQPEDVAEAVAWLAAPGSAAVSGQVVRVCGQSLIGA
jgi:3-oxoacyl-[acyl-carrier protein] reductase